MMRRAEAPPRRFRTELFLEQTAGAQSSGLQNGEQSLEGSWRLLIPTADSLA